MIKVWYLDYCVIVNCSDEALATGHPPLRQRHSHCGEAVRQSGCELEGGGVTVGLRYLSLHST